MFTESLARIESRLQNLIDQLELSKMEVEDLRSENTRLVEENARLQQELASWGEQLSSLVNKLDEVSQDEHSYQQEHGHEHA